MKLKTRLGILAIMWVVTIALAMLAANTNSFMFLSAGSITAFAVEDKQPATDDGPLSFKTMTVAVCEKTESESIYCHDEIKVVCGNESYILPKESGKATCGELKVNTAPITAFAVFEKDWKDPRDS